MELAIYFVAEFQTTPNYMNKEGETCFVKKERKERRHVKECFFNDMLC